MARDTVDATPIEGRDELVAWIEKGIKPETAFRLGTEHEKFPFYIKDNAPVPYETPAGRAGGIRALLEGMQVRLGWEPILEHGNPIGLFDSKGGGAISLEPGGQFELSGAPLATVHETAVETDAHLAHANAVANAMGIRFLALGGSPLWTRAETPIMPKARYKIMADYMPKVGGRGLDMMFRTCTVQVNLDFSSEAQMVKMMRVSLALQPIVTALFANSPFTEGRLNGFLSMRSEIWRDTDNQRSGMLPLAFEDGFGFERYVDYALDVPLYFVKRGDLYHDVAGGSFRALLKGTLATLPGERAYVSDWANHLTTLFPEVRLKRYIEMRGADAGPLSMLNALPAFWVGLLYDHAALDAAYEMIGGWTATQRQQLRDDVPRLGLAAKIAGRSARDVARDALALSQNGLRARNKLDSDLRDESRFLEPLMAIAESGKGEAERYIERFEGVWKRSVEPVFVENVL
jgi:glutamate--cysteine ligase